MSMQLPPDFDETIVSEKDVFFVAEDKLKYLREKFNGLLDEAFQMMREDNPQHLVSSCEEESHRFIADLIKDCR